MNTEHHHDIYLQRVINSKNTSKLKFMYEVFFRPQDMGNAITTCFESYYYNLTKNESKLKKITSNQLQQINKLFDHLQKQEGEYEILINIEPCILPLITNEIAQLKKRCPINVSIVVEITERVDMKNEKMLPSIIELNDYGVELALDDFTGRKDVRNKWIQNIPFKYIKMSVDDLKKEKVEFIQKIKHQHKETTKLIIEKVESTKDINDVHKFSVDYFQGYLFEKPWKYNL